MGQAEKFVTLLVFVIFLVAFINRGSFGFGTSPQGASASVGYRGFG